MPVSFSDATPVVRCSFCKSIRRFAGTHGLLLLRVCMCANIRPRYMLSWCEFAGQSCRYVLFCFVFYLSFVIITACTVSTSVSMVIRNCVYVGIKGLS